MMLHSRRWQFDCPCVLFYLPTKNWNLHLTARGRRQVMLWGNCPKFQYSSCDLYKIIRWFCWCHDLKMLRYLEIRKKKTRECVLWQYLLDCAHEQFFFSLFSINCVHLAVSLSWRHAISSRWILSRHRGIGFGTLLSLMNYEIFSNLMPCDLMHSTIAANQIVFDGIIFEYCNTYSILH